MPEKKGGAPRGKPHRAAGQGSVYRETVTRRDGTTYLRWVAAISLPSGKRKRQVTKTQREANALLKKLQVDAATPAPTAEQQQTVGDYLDWWLEHSFRGRATSKVTYEVCIRVHLKPAFGATAMGDLRPEHVETLVTAMRDAGYAATTINNTRAVLRAALGLAVRRERVTRNAAAMVDPIRREIDEPEPLSGEECQRWIAALRSHRQGALWVTAICTGLRQGELLGLRWQDVDLEHARLTVRQQVQRVHGKRIFMPPKTRTSQRTLPLPTLLTELLRAHAADQAEARLFAGDTWQDHDLVFPGAHGQPQDASSVWIAFQRALQRAELGAHPFHYLRHVYQSLLISLGTNPWVAMSLLGHADLRVSRRYTHIADSAKSAAIDQLDALLRA